MMQTYTISDVARILRVSRNYVHEMITQDKLRAVRVGENRIRITEESIKKLLNGEDNRVSNE